MDYLDWRLNLNDVSQNGRGGNHIPKLKRFFARHPELAGKAIEVIVGHDSWCAIYKDQECDCDPDISLANEIGCA